MSYQLEPETSHLRRCLDALFAKVRPLVPFSSGALFFYDEDRGTLRCRFATGVEAEILQQVTVKMGYGITGWVGRHHRALINARPSADLEAGEMATETLLQSALVSPLIFNNRFLGTLSVYHIEAGCYTDDHCWLLGLLLEQGSADIYHAVVADQLSEDSMKIH